MITQIDSQVLRVIDRVIKCERKSVQMIRQLAETEENYLVIMREIDRVEAQLVRARGLHVEATLTLIEWFATLDHFHWRCAYCQTNAFQLMGHVEPISQKGTTYQNCIPACRHCRGSKRKDYTHIQKYIAGIQLQPAPSESITHH